MDIENEGKALKRALEERFPGLSTNQIALHLKTSSTALARYYKQPRWSEVTWKNVERLCRAADVDPVHVRRGLPPTPRQQPEDLIHAIDGLSDDQLLRTKAMLELPVETQQMLRAMIISRLSHRR